MILNGYNVIVAPIGPRMTLSDNVPVTQEFRDEMNLWMLRFFGTTCIVERGQTYVMKNTRTMVVHPADYVALQEARRTEQESRPFGMSVAALQRRG